MAESTLDTALSTVMLRRADRDLRAVAKAQANIRSVLMGGEHVIAVAVDDGSGPILIVTSQRILVVEQGRRGRVSVVPPAKLSVAVPENSGVTLDGYGIFIKISDRAAAEKLAKSVNTLVIDHRPRSIPRLYPRYYEQILAASPLGSVHRTNRVYDRHPGHRVLCPDARCRGSRGIHTRLRTRRAGQLRSAHRRRDDRLALAVESLLPQGLTTPAGTVGRYGRSA